MRKDIIIVAIALLRSDDEGVLAGAAGLWSFLQRTATTIGSLVAVAQDIAMRWIERPKTQWQLKHGTMRQRLVEAQNCSKAWRVSGLT